MWKALLIGVVGLAGMATTALAQSCVGVINVQIDSGTPSSVACGLPITVNVNEISGIKIVRIWSTSRDGQGLPLGSAGVITINGTDTNNDGQLRLVVKGTTGSNFTGQTNLGPDDLGLTNLAGITIPTESLRRRTRLVAGLSGNLTGDITIGQVHRLQVGGFADGNCEGATGGVINGNITAVALNNAFNFKSIEYVSASRGIAYGKTLRAGTDLAVADGYSIGNPATYADIGRVRLGYASNSCPPSQTVTSGLQGEIKANKGRIFEILCPAAMGYTTIGSPGVPVFTTIEAADGIFSIRAQDLEGINPDLLENKQFFVNVRANTIVDQAGYAALVSNPPARHRAQRAA